MEPTQNRFDLLREPSPSPTLHEPTPSLHAAPALPAFISAREAMVLRDAMDEPIVLTPTPTPSESLNDSTLLPTLTPTGMVAVLADHAASPSLVDGLNNSASTASAEGGARLLTRITALEDGSSHHPSLATNPADHADDPEYLAVLGELLNVPHGVSQEDLSQITHPSQRLAATRPPTRRLILMAAFSKPSGSLTLPRLRNHPDWHSEHAQRVASTSHVGLTRPSMVPAPASPPVALSLFRDAVAAPGAPGDDSSSSSSASSDTPRGSPIRTGPEGSPSETGSHTPTEHSTILHEQGDHTRKSILVDTPSDSSHSDPQSRSPPEDMGRARRGGKMSTAPCRALDTSTPSFSPPQAYWNGGTQTQEAKDTLEELRTLAAQPRVAREALSQAQGAKVKTEQLADPMNPERLGYAYYIQKEGLPPLKEGVVVGSEESMNAAFDITTAALSLGLDAPAGAQLRAFSSSKWFRAAALILSAIIRAVLVSDHFFTPGDFSLPSSADTFQLAPGLPIPPTQRALLAEMAAQLTSELTALGENRLNRAEFWAAISERERTALQAARA
ncbi:hypothetical protein EDB92DRAFT_1966170 [Lactarius akahatsu]|uniref:Uncharacterized protein n=1 Tax=Lactarius akahatsu TaxID=416441 RepID=A0AAD4LTE1_9AGAM|nr:hypothetical protein EDB92DRAFT_1966170 [Lactarius akahatsu]